MFHGCTGHDNHVSGSSLRRKGHRLLRGLELFSNTCLGQTSTLLFRSSPRRCISNSCVGVKCFEKSVSLICRSRIRNGLVGRITGMVSLVYAGCLGTVVSCRNVRHVRALPIPHRTLQRTVLGTYVGGSCDSPAPVRVEISSGSLRVIGNNFLPRG